MALEAYMSSLVGVVSLEQGTDGSMVLGAGEAILRLLRRLQGNIFTEGRPQTEAHPEEGVLEQCQETKLHEDCVRTIQRDTSPGVKQILGTWLLSSYVPVAAMWGRDQTDARDSRWQIQD